MSFRARLFLAFLAAVLLPLALLAYGVHREMTTRLIAEYERRAAALVSVIRDDLEAESRRVAGHLATVASELRSDSRFRLAAVRGAESDRRWLLDYAGEAMRVSGLAMLQIQDSAGRIISSGHFRNAYDRLEPRLPRVLAAAPNGVALVRTRTAETTFLVLASVDSFGVGGRRFSVVGGAAVDSSLLSRLARDPDLRVMLVSSDAASQLRESRSPAERVVSTLTLPYVDASADSASATSAADSVQVAIVQRLTALESLRRSVDLWFLAAVVATAALAVLLAGWLASRVSRPLSELARKTAEIDLDRLDQDFATDRSDEIGALARLLGAMTERLRQGATRLRDAERRATVADIARQVNHDIKNGLAPIRHVLRHLQQVAESAPAQLPAVFAERQGTLASSVAYLETLAQNYARLSPRLDREPCDVNVVVQQVIRNVPAGPAQLELRLSEQLPEVRADAVVLRRILENLVGNAVESLESRAGSVTVSTDRGPTRAPGEAGGSNGAGAAVRITVSDTGRGMTRDEMDHAFDDFYTTKEHGTGLGLSVVRRLVMDLHGTLRVETEPGVGSRFTVELPAGPPSS